VLWYIFSTSRIENAGIGISDTIVPIVFRAAGNGMTEGKQSTENFLKIIANSAYKKRVSNFKSNIRIGSRFGI